MFDIETGDNGTIVLSGRLDAAQAEKAQNFLDAANGLVVLDLLELEYISSAGLGVLLKTHKQMMGLGGGLKLVNVNKHTMDIFGYSGFDKLFEIEPASG
jgi:anti-sigma B factor antagonist